MRENYIYIMRNGFFKLYLNGKLQGGYFFTRFTVTDAKKDSLSIIYAI